jgi:hypothetical protein
MLSLLVVVFLIQLACHLILTIGSKPINDLVCHAMRLSLFPLSTYVQRPFLLTHEFSSYSYGKSTVVSL